MIEIPEGSATLGLERCENQPVWLDNEYESAPLQCRLFRRPIRSHQPEYLQFMNAGGYENEALWRGADWQWKTQHNISHPVFWNRLDGEWQYRRCLRMFACRLTGTVYVSHAEASAYARWRRRRCPLRRQWHRRSVWYAGGTRDRIPGELKLPIPGSETSISRAGTHARRAFRQGESAFGVGDLVATGGSGRPRRLLRSPVFSPSSFIPATRPVSSKDRRTHACRLARAATLIRSARHRRNWPSSRIKLEGLKTGERSKRRGRHSHPLPTRSPTRNALSPCRKARRAWGPALEIEVSEPGIGSFSSPGIRLSVPSGVPYAARCHCASVGNAFSAQRAYALASA